jgi:hypothetical protein
MTPERLFTQAELDALCVLGAARILSALDPLDRARAKAVFRDVDSAYREFHQIYHAWVGTIFEFLLERHGHDALTQAVPLGGGLAAASAMKLDAEAMSLVADGPQRFDTLVDAGEIDDARGLVHRHEVVARELHDWYRDWVSALLSHVYRRFGTDGLEACLRYSSEKGWMPWMMEDVTHDPPTRLREWARLLCVGNFATLTIEEDDEKFLIVQDPCGSCGLQDDHNRGEPPWHLALVRERHPITFCRGDVSAYRTHIAVMHTIMPLERIGAPWPPIHCPKTVGEPCRILFYKDPKRVDDSDWARVGMKPPNVAAP